MNGIDRVGAPQKIVHEEQEREEEEEEFSFVFDAFRENDTATIISMA